VKWRPSRAWATVSLLAGLSLLPVSAGAAVVPRAVPLRDPRINEASALVDLGSLWVTSNDSGDTARLFVVSPVTGRTIGIVRVRVPVQDVEALAPAGVSSVWVGDIGDNDGKRRSITVFRVTVGPGLIDVTTRPYRLVYPRGHPNAESMFVDGQGRLNIITKNIGGGIVYRAPARLDSTRLNRLQAVGRVAEYATDAARSRDGRHLIVRGPEIAGVYTLPDFQRVGAFRLPRQPQGEGVSVGPTGKVRVDSEGAHTAVLEVTLPPALLRVFDPALAPPPPTPTPSPSPSPTPSPSAASSPASSRNSDDSSSSSSSSSSGGIGAVDPPWLMWCIPAVIGVGALGIGLGLRRRAE
jgi:hypothetical protein